MAEITDLESWRKSKEVHIGSEHFSSAYNIQPVLVSNTDYFAIALINKTPGFIAVFEDTPLAKAIKGIPHIREMFSKNELPKPANDMDYIYFVPKEEKKEEVKQTFVQEPIVQSEVIRPVTANENKTLDSVTFEQPTYNSISTIQPNKLENIVTTYNKNHYPTYIHTAIRYDGNIPLLDFGSNSRFGLHGITYMSTDKYHRRPHYRRH